MNSQEKGRDLVEVINTPRTMEACCRIGISITDLKKKTIADFKVPGFTPDIQKLRLHHSDQKRRAMILRVHEERGRIIQEELETQDKSTSQVPIGAIESLLSVELGRMQKHLRRQHQTHAAVENDNRDQIEKEMVLQQKLLYRRKRTEQMEENLRQKSQQISKNVHSKIVTANSKKREIEESRELRRKESAVHTQAVRERLRRFEESNHEKQAQRSEAWQEKRQQMYENKNERWNERTSKYKDNIDRYQERISQIKEQQEKENADLSFKKQLETLKLHDVRERRIQLTKMEAYTRLQLAKKVEEEQTRVDTFIKVKDHITEKRKNFLKSQVNSSSSGQLISLKSIQPGPADYSNFANTVLDVPSAKMSLSVLPSHLDICIDRTKDNPSPGDYDVSISHTGEKSWSVSNAPNIGGKAPRKTYLDTVAENEVPGPGAYSAYTDYRSDNCQVRMRAPVVEGSVNDPYISLTIPNAKKKESVDVKSAIPGLSKAFDISAKLLD